MSRTNKKLTKSLSCFFFFFFARDALYRFIAPITLDSICHPWEDSVSLEESDTGSLWDQVGNWSFSSYLA